MTTPSGILSTALLLLLFPSCSKDTGEDVSCNEVTPALFPAMATVEPAPYLPAFPGSWWAYSDGSMITTGPGYVASPVLSTNWDPNHGVDRCCASGVARLPIYGGLPLYGYLRMRPDAPSTVDGSCCERLLSTTEGDVYHWGGIHYGRTELRTMRTDTTLVLASGATYTACIMVKCVQGIAANYFDIATTYDLTFYAPGVGLVKEVKHVGADTMVRELTDHWIAEH
ncbi:MAG TPA: hypothetical protein VGE21_09180 [Flavobacteriales bacterium]